MDTPDFPDPWPLSGLRLRTPRLELRPDDDAGLAEMVALAYGGVHPPEEMPFATPWTDADLRYLGRGALQHFWSERAAVRPEKWGVHFLVRLDGRVIGVQSLLAADFGVTRTVETGSWLGLPHQRQGYGSEMRAAVLGLAFERLGAVAARSGAFVDNAASLAVSRRLGYRADGSDTVVRRGVAATMVRLVLSRDDFAAHRPPWRPEVTGLDACLGLLGAG